MRSRTLVSSRFLRRAVFPLALMATITVLSHSKLPGGLPSGADKLAHLLVFGALAAGWQHALRATRLRARRAVWIAFCVTVAWGALDEWHQSFVPGRYASVGDLLADAVGALIVVILMGRETTR